MKKSLHARLVARWRSYSFVNWLRYLLGREIKDSKWIFILGCYNSGTTLLDEILSRHPDITGLSDEGVMLTDALPRPEDFGWRRMWYQCEEKMVIKEKTASQTADRVKRHWSFFYDKNKYLLEKSIANTPRAIFFDEHFKPAYFIHVVRNGYAVAEGIRRKAQPMRQCPQKFELHYPIEMCAEQWVKSLKSVEEQRTKLRHFIEVKYESLTENPLSTLKVITDFLGIPEFKTEQISGTFQIHEHSEPIRNLNSQSISNLSKADLKAVEIVAKNQLKKYQYID